ncbi:MAG: HAD family phosphatase [Oscillospiraceae bacterium]|nr:HAD family phosphatase [Oscillospiraceae bacterium]
MLTDYNAIIFDMDGTLVDSLDIWAEADKRFILSQGREYDDEISYSMKTMHFDQACLYLIEKLSLDMTLEQIEAILTKNIEESYLNDVKLKPFTLEFLEAERKKGIKMCIATSNKKRLAQALTAKLGIYDFFEFIITSDEVGTSKDNPSIFLQSAERLGSCPSKAIVFEDSLHAAEASVKAGFYTIGVFDKYSAGEFELLKKTVSRAIMSFEELV